MEESQQVQMEEDQFMEERESSLRELDSVVVQNTVSEIVRETEYEDPEAVIVARELDQLYLAQQREHNLQNLDSALKRKQSMLNKVKAKEEVELCTLQNEIGEIRETRKHTEKEIESLNELKKELQVTVEIGALELLKTQNCVENTTTTLKTLKSNYDNLEEFEKLIAQDIANLDADYVALGDYYRTGKEASIKKMNANKEVIKNTRLKILNFSLKDNTQIEALQKRLDIFLKTEKDDEEAFVRLNQKHDVVLKQYYGNQLELFKEELERKNLQDMIDNIDLDTIEKQKIDEKTQQDEILDNQMKKLVNANERLVEVENFKKLLKNKIEEVREYNSKLKEQLLTLDNEKINLISVRQKLQENIDNASLNLKTNQDLNETKITKVSSEIAQSHMDKDVVSKKTEELVKKLEDLQEDYNNSLKILESLLQLENECQETLQVETRKRREIEETIVTLEAELKQSKLSLTEIHENIKTIQSLRLVDTQRLTDRLNEAKERLMQVEQDGESKIKASFNEQNTYEWNLEESKKENVARNQRELAKLNENVETLELTSEKNNQKMQQLIKSIEDKNGELNSLKKEIDYLKLAQLIKKPSQNLSRGIKPKAKGKPHSSEESIPTITLDTTTEDESDNERDDFGDMFSELRNQL